MINEIAITNNTLITEACRGEGAHLLNKNNERFMKHYAPQEMELASRDIVARAIVSEIQENRGFIVDGKPCVHLQLSHLGKKKIRENKSFQEILFKLQI